MLEILELGSVCPVPCAASYRWSVFVEHFEKLASLRSEGLRGFDPRSFLAMNLLNKIA